VLLIVMYESGIWRVRPGQSLTFGRGQTCTIRLPAGDRGLSRSAGSLDYAEHCGERPNVNGSPGRTRQVCASYITISSTGPARLPKATVGSPQQPVNRPAPAEQQRRIRRAPAWPVIRHGGLGGAVRQRLSGAIGPAPMANAMCSPGAVAGELPGEVAGADAQRPPGSRPAPAAAGWPARGAAGPGAPDRG
jgi:hypothetical protein